MLIRFVVKPFLGLVSSGLDRTRHGLRVIAAEDYYFSAGSKGVIITSPYHC